MKKAVITIMFAALCVTGLTAQNYKDGFYFAQDADFMNNQKNQVVIEVKDGKIASANWNILSLNAGTRDLKSIARTENMAAAATWAARANVAEQYLVTNQNTNVTSVPGGPANVKPFFDLAKKALSAQAIQKGAYSKDGWYYREAAAADAYHTKNSVLITIVNGTIVDVLWNGILQGMPANINPSKMITSRANGYPMTNAKKAWHIQSANASEALVKAQNPDSIKIKANGIPDAISGVSVQIKDFLDTSRAALQAAR
jgi:major membrane immunogen (membrane-anchored lipoprotein)